MRTNAMLTGKRDSRRHSTTNFGNNVLVAKTSGEGFTFFKGNKRTKFFGEKKQKKTKNTMLLSGGGGLFLENKRENEKLKSSLY